MKPRRLGLKTGLVFFTICAFLLVLESASAQNTVTTYPNLDLPHLARDFSILIPENFDRNYQSSGIIIKSNTCNERLIWFTSKEVFPNQYFDFTIGGLSPDTEYEFEVKIYSSGLYIRENVAFRTEPAPVNEIKRVLLVIDEELSDYQLRYWFWRYARDLWSIDPHLRVELYYIGDDFESKKELYNYLKDAYFSRNIHYVFFIGDNATMPIYIYTLNEEGEVLKQYFYQSLSFYTNIWNNEFEYDETEDRYIRKFYINCPVTDPELQTRLIYGRFPEISFGVLAPTKEGFDEEKAQVINYFQKLHAFRTGEFSFDNKILYSDTVNGNEHMADEISAITRWEGNVALDRWEPGGGEEWKDAYLDALAALLS
jgi:hypothetical protein